MTFASPKMPGVSDAWGGMGPIIIPNPRGSPLYHTVDIVLSAEQQNSDSVPATQYMMIFRQL